MIFLTTNHKVGDVVYVVGSCVRRGIVQKATFCQQNDSDNQFALSYDILYDGFTYNTEVESEVDFNISGTGSPRAVGSPVSSGSPLGSPAPGGVGSPLAFTIAAEEITNGGDIYSDKNAALTAFGDTLA
jgi:hypothetical protein